MQQHTPVLALHAKKFHLAAFSFRQQIFQNVTFSSPAHDYYIFPFIVFPPRQGDGLAVRWKESGSASTYSRLVGGPDNDCVYAEEAEDGGGRMWSKDECRKGHATPCVKRGCAPKERDSPKAQHSANEE